MEEKNLQKRKPNRWEKHDYSKVGRYFITLCTEDRKTILWEGKFNPQKYNVISVGANCVRPQNLPLSKWGAEIFSELEKWNNCYTNIWIDFFVIMPNHIHLIIVIGGDDGGRTQFAPTISRMVKQFKGKITKTVGRSIFQKSFFDRVIRNEEEYVKIRKYLYENPLKWQEDELYTEA